MARIEGSSICECSICKNYHSFNMPNEIVEAAKKNELILFCGAGISTESKIVLPTSFYVDILNQLNKEYQLSLDFSISFSDLMSKFCEVIPNGRKELVRAIKNRFDRVNSFPELFNSATKFHKEVSKIPQINTVITTNWDDYFERECAMFPIIDDKDVRLWNTFDKKVFKVHGSINNIGSIVATTEDYGKCYERLSKKPIGDRLKVLLGSYCVVFIGFSFGDDDLNKIINILSEDMDEFANQFYLVTTDKSWEENDNNKIIPIITDGYFFVHSLKNILQHNGDLVSEDIYDFATYANDATNEFHTDWINDTKEFNDNLEKFPELILSIAYQDGMIHAYQRCYANRSDGAYLKPNYLVKFISSYKYLYEKQLKDKNYTQAYYDLGYLNGLISIQVFITTQEVGIPPQFVYKNEYFNSYEELTKFIQTNRNKHIFKACKKIKDDFLSEGVIPHFLPWYC